MFRTLKEYHAKDEFADEVINYLLLEEYNGGMDVIQTAVTRILDKYNFDYPYVCMWDKVFESVICKLDKDDKLAYILLRNRAIFD